MPSALNDILRNRSALRLLRNLVASPISSLDVVVSSKACSRCHVVLSQKRRGLLSPRTAPAVSADNEERPSVCNTSTANVSSSPGRDKSTMSAMTQPVAAIKSNWNQWAVMNRSDDLFEVARWRSEGVQPADDPWHNYDFQPWIDMLEYGQRLEGLEGVRHVWERLVERGVLLPTKGACADKLWGSFLELGFHNPDVLDGLFVYSTNLVNHGLKPWTHLYEKVLAFCLESMPAKTLGWYNLHSRYEGRYHSKECLARLAPVALSGKQSLRQLRMIYRRSGCTSFYETIMPLICSQEWYGVAYNWHVTMLRQGDLPSSSDVVEPLMDAMARRKNHGQLRGLTESLRNAGVPLKQLASPTLNAYQILSGEVINRALGETFGIPPKTLSDRFCARLFATRAFPIDGILGGLEILGVEAIGPLSMRELAARVESPLNLRKRFAQLRDAGISTGSSTLSRLLRKCAVEDDQILMEDLLTSDQHPDVLEDYKLQRSLLRSYLRAQDWRQLNRTMEILTVSSLNPTMDKWNLLFRTYLSCRDLTAATKVVDEMHVADIPITLASSSWIWRTMLYRRRKMDSLRPVRFLPRLQVQRAIEMFKGIQSNGNTLSPHLWTETLRQLSRRGQMDELRNLSMWLVSNYGSSGDEPPPLLHTSARKASNFQSRAAVRDGGSSPRYQSPQPSPLQCIFNLNLQKEIASIGLSFDPRYGSPDHYNRPPEGWPTSLSYEHWPPGVTLLKELKGRGVPIDANALSEGLKWRLLIMMQQSISRNHIIPQEQVDYLRRALEDSKRNWGGPVLTGEDDVEVQQFLELGTSPK
ncbi:MAG: hypothetical protein M1837_003986 [Sclerophora amabilis]|nr:MAG: hypothetical protein M1837_003986 [Sclerophora amabilis]